MFSPVLSPTPTLIFFRTADFGSVGDQAHGGRGQHRDREPSQRVPHRQGRQGLRTGRVTGATGGDASRRSLAGGGLSRGAKQVSRSCGASASMKKDPGNLCKRGGFVPRGNVLYEKRKTEALFCRVRRGCPGFRAKVFCRETWILAR